MKRISTLLGAALMTLGVSLVHAQALQQPQAPAAARPAPPPAATPAPVPAAVAIPRPTEAEVARARASLDRYLATVDADTRALLQRYPGLLEVRPPGPNSAVVPSLAPMFNAKHQANQQVAREGNAELLLMGDSITDFWRNPEGPFAGKPVLDKHFGKWKIANFGIAGDTTQGVLYRLQDGEGEGFSPRAIMLMIGTNNTARNSAAGDRRGHRRRGARPAEALPGIAAAAARRVPARARQ